ncbi:MAG TPA: transporter [Alteromonas macleodii]|jgi:small-conductance mechanosensitive channel|uniref:mechanosensitive ion channel family protein n=1 Tax=Alteromonas TaxID=226 RepID=UPI000029AE56|nr:MULTISPECIES: mechanosensitive ion channel domain-containing protein [Alteromonas]MAL71088.1 transporter [Alteromonas sp.]MEC8451776.1 mechanosensitive ion channel domain-containing protein [Pseudomonadota bacterium]AMN10214.1 transporter [Alteromonas macleodii]MCG7655561.1 mechanosensitive ion channel [Alteromonas sp. Cnat2-8]MDK2762782.1 mechanosensitive ion channel [Alteromonas macleodii]|tara:strand:- start:33 stop:893 length:861 start_codon:yes stop_codon:yes gene_type:complete
MDLNIWAQSFSNAFNRFWTEVAGFLPNLIATVIVVLFGLFVSKVLTKWVAKLLEKLGFDSLCEKLGIHRLINSMGFKTRGSELIGKLLHLFFILIILVAAAETLGLERFSAILDEFILYLPKLFGALLIALIGLFIAKTGKSQLETSLENVGVEYGAAAGRVLQLLVLFITFSLVIGQLELETELLNTIFTVLIASLGIALALALGLGTQTVANSIVSGIYAREQLLPGDEVEFEGFVGNVVSVSTVNTLLESKEGKRLSIPNQDLLSSKFVVTKLGATKRTDNKT